MARQGNSLGARVRKLEAAERKAGDLKRGTKLTAEPMAQLVGVSWVLLRSWADELAGFEESGVFVRGGNGIEWEFNPLQTVRWLLKHFRAEQAAKAKRAKAIRRAVAGDALDDLPDDYSITEIRDAIRVAGELRAEQEKQGRLVDATLVAEMVDGMLQRMLRAAINARHKQDPANQFSPDVAEKIDSAFTALIVDQQNAALEFLNGLRGSRAQPG